MVPSVSERIRVEGFRKVAEIFGSAAFGESVEVKVCPDDSAGPTFPSMQALRIDGKFFRAGEDRVHLRAVTYGPFPSDRQESFDEDFRRIAAAGFQSIRLFEMPGKSLLEAAGRHGLWVFGGLKWACGMDFIREPRHFSEARVSLAEALREIRHHPALAGVYVGNEIPSDVVRWIGPAKAREAIESLIDLGRGLAPELLFAYGNYPSTEYLEPENADFTAFNVYLESETAFRRYLRRLHHIAGDRPLMISEFGLDSRRNGLEAQAETLVWAGDAAREEAAAGFTVYAWSDLWQNGERLMHDWDFGLNDRRGQPKPALSAISQSALRRSPSAIFFSVIVCTRNGVERIGACLRAIRRMAGVRFETIVVDDGSADGTADLVADHYPWVKLVRLDPGGLSAARNAGAAAAGGEVLAFTDDDCEPDREWLMRLLPVFADGRFSAVGGPNLPPPARTLAEAVVSAAPGAPSHVMLDDEEAEHLPGCNLAVTRKAFDAVGGFDPVFHTAGDDVDFCWRLRNAGHRLGFAPGAFVWHWRRPSLRTFLRQQRGYGEAERLLLGRHPQRFTSRGDAIWSGFVYNGGPLRATGGSLIYHGPMGLAGYQSVVSGMMPLRGIEPRFDNWMTRMLLSWVSWLQPRVRSWARCRSILMTSRESDRTREAECVQELVLWSESGRTREDFLRLLLADGWLPAGETDRWDVERDGRRLLLATEQGAGIGRRTLVRVWGRPIDGLEQMVQRA